MKKINLYLAKNVFYMILLVSSVFMSIDFVFGVLGEAHAIGHNGYTWHNAVLYILLRLPSDYVLILPIAGFLGTLTTLLMLSSKSEMIALRAAGFSMRQTARAVLLAGSGILFFYYAMSLFIAPYTRHLSYLEENLAGKSQNILVLSSEIWLKSGNHFLLMGRVLPNGIIENVTDFIINNGMLTTVRKIDSISLQNDGNWILSGVSATHINSTGVTRTNIATVTESSLISTNLLPALSMQPEEMMIFTLANYIKFRMSNQLDVKSYELQFWNRIFAPLMLPILMLIAIPFGITGTRNSIQIRIVSAAILGFVFYIVSQFFGTLTLLTPVLPIFGAGLPVFVFGVFALLLFNLWR